MAGLIAALGDDLSSVDFDNLDATVNPIGNMEVDRCLAGHAYLSCSRHALAPTVTNRIVDNDQFSGIVSGDVVGTDAIDWSNVWAEIFGNVGGFPCLSAMRGTFVLAIYDKTSDCLSVVSDAFAWRPLYFSIAGNNALFSTRLASFHVSPIFRQAFNEQWLYEHLFFNYAVGQTTMMKNVFRVPAGTVCTFGRRSGELTQTRYCDPPAPRNPLYGERDSIERAREVFGKTVPKYFSSKYTTSFGLSAGLDSRSVLAAVPDQRLSRTETFTYGLDNSTELDEVAEFVARSDLPHTNVSIDSQMLARLPALMHETVFLSDGLQNVNRAHLVDVYRSLRVDNAAPATIVTGVSGDHLFRDHIQGWGNVPYLVSASFASCLRSGVTDDVFSEYSEIIAGDAGNFSDYIRSVIDDLQEHYGRIPDASAYLKFLLYEAGPRYFAGQAAIADAFSTFRTPFWDRDMIQLCHDVELGTLGFSRSLEKKDRYREAVLQASVVAASERTRNIPYLDMPIQAFSRNNRLLHLPWLLARKARTFLRGQPYRPFEDWPRWYRTVAHDEVERLLGGDCRLAQFVNADYIARIRASDNVHWLGKLLTAEIALRLFETGWSAPDTITDD